MATFDLFDAYFRRADADRDGRISGQEAVAFFQGANLNREVLAKVWQYADKGQSGFLSRSDFYNALKLVTVAQSGRELTPALVSKALSEPTLSQIPAPQIKMAPTSTSMVPQAVGSARPVRPPIVPGQQQFATGLLPQGTPTTATQLQRASTLSSPPVPSNVSSDWSNHKSSSWPDPGSVTGTIVQQPQTKATFPSQDSFQGNSRDTTPVNTKTTTVEPDLFGGDIFTAVPTKPQIAPLHGDPKGLPQVPQVGLTAAKQLPSPNGIPLSGQPSITSIHGVSNLSTTSVAAPKQPQAVASPVGQGVASPAGQAEQEFTAPMGLVESSKPWPKMTDAIVRNYTKIFLEVDSDKDGKISGSQARDLFLSWQLPREVLKQVWDLSDQDHDSMLSLREFCVALYLMERHREGSGLPATVSPSYYFDETGFQALRSSEARVAVSQTSAGLNVPIWQQRPDSFHASSPSSQVPPPSMPVGSAPQAIGHSLPPRPVSQIQSPRQAQVKATSTMLGKDSVLPVQQTPMQPTQQKSKAPVLEMYLVNQLPADDQLTLQTKHQEAVDAEKKVFELEKQIMDSKEKMDFYRTKMQEIVLFKTRCDNRLAELSERTSSDKREVEIMTKRYNEKFKQAGDSQSRLLTDEAAFRDVQERRLELYNTILRFEQGGDNTASLQSRAEKVQTDLDELRKSLNSKCKELGVMIKPTVLLDLPYGWKVGMQENAAAWDDDWDKFDDEGFTYVQEFMEDGNARNDMAKPNSSTTWDENAHYEDGSEISDERSSNAVDGSEDVTHDLFVNGHIRSPSEMSSSEPIWHVQPSIIDATDSTAKDAQSHGLDPALWPSEANAFTDEGGDWASAFSHRSDDTDSTVSWGRNDATSVKASEEPGFLTGKSGTVNSFGYGEPFDNLSSPVHTKDDQDGMPSFGPIRTKESSSVFFDNSVPSTPLYGTTSFGQSSSKALFDESVPSTPLYNVTKNQGPPPELFRFDSFSSTATNDIGGHGSDSFMRFDSFTSTAGGPPNRFTSFDDSDPFAGSGPFGSQASRRGSDTSSPFT